MLVEARTQNIKAETKSEMPVSGEYLVATLATETSRIKHLCVSPTVVGEQFDAVCRVLSEIGTMAAEY